MRDSVFDILIKGKIKECELKREEIITVIKTDIERMLACHPVNTVESEKAKFCSRHLYDFIMSRVQHFDSNTAEELIKAMVTIKGFFQILNEYEKEKIEQFKDWLVRS